MLWVLYLSTNLSCFRFFIVLERVIGETGQGKYIVDALNYRDKHMLNLSLSKILNPELIHVCPNFYKSMEVHEKEEDKAVILATEYQHVEYIYFVL